MTPISSLYVHVPFCAHKCEYCAFYSHAPGGDVVDRYVRALVRELEMVAPMVKPKTVFFGGGTPSLLNLRQWEEVFAAMERLGLLGAEEFTVECNPATVSLDKASLLRSRGVNRVSMGVQSLDENLLDRLGRIHSREQVFKSFDILRKAGFESINIDLMFAIPTQTMDLWKATLREATAMGSEHLSCYEVIYEEDTPLYAQLKAKEFDVDEDLSCAMYDELIDHATGAGYQQYEVANFARDNGPARGDALEREGLARRACRHNVNYWRGGFSVGVGPSASGFEPSKTPGSIGVRLKNWSNTTLYCEQLEKGSRAIESRDELEPMMRAGELAAFGMRMMLGWPWDAFKARTGVDLREHWSAEIADLVQRGWAVADKKGLRLTQQGIRFADAAGAEFLGREAVVAT